MKKIVNSKFVKIIIFIAIIFSSFTMKNVLAENIEDKINIEIVSSEDKIKKEEEFSIIINLSNLSVSAYDIEINFDNNLVEYISNIENTSFANGKILSSWYDTSGGKNAKENCELIKYKFRTRDIGNSLISIKGKMYDNLGKEVASIEENRIISVVEENQEIMSNTNNEDNTNSKLKEMRLNHEGITPEFNPEITEYYFTTENLNELEVTANSQNKNSRVEITGNKDFKIGINEININVMAPNMRDKTNYKIYVTKTNNIELANANLENLAIENAILSPEFNENILEYKTEVSNTIENLNILAIPQKINAKVEIDGGKNLKYGNNEIIIKVIAENGYTSKKYKVNVYRRNEQEQLKAEEEKRKELEKLEQILQKNNNENVKLSIEEIEGNIENLEKEERKSNLFLISIITIVLAIGIFIVIKRRKNKMIKNKKTIYEKK